MSLPLTSEIVTERVDDIPVLLAHLKKMGVPELLDEHFPPQAQPLPVAMARKMLIQQPRHAHLLQMR